MYLSRTLCDVLEEMRKLDETKNYAGLLGLIEEAQSMGNRMEAKLTDLRDFKDFDEELREKKKELKKLRVQVRDLENKLED